LYPASASGSHRVAADIHTVESGSEGDFIGHPAYSPCPAYTQLTHRVETSAAWTSRIAAMAPHEAALRVAWNITGPDPPFPNWVTVSSRTIVTYVLHTHTCADLTHTLLTLGHRRLCRCGGCRRHSW
jgi:hypothetical protein